MPISLSLSCAGQDSRTTPLANSDRDFLTSQVLSLCLSEMNRHHYALYVHNCRLVFLLRKDFDQADTFRPAEFHWKLDQVRLLWAPSLLITTVSCRDAVGRRLKFWSLVLEKSTPEAESFKVREDLGLLKPFVEGGSHLPVTTGRVSGPTHMRHVYFALW